MSTPAHHDGSPAAAPPAPGCAPLTCGDLKRFLNTIAYIASHADDAVAGAVEGMGLTEEQQQQMLAAVAAVRGPPPAIPAGTAHDHTGEPTQPGTPPAAANCKMYAVACENRPKAPGTAPGCASAAAAADPGACEPAEAPYLLATSSSGGSAASAQRGFGSLDNRHSRLPGYQVTSLNRAARRLPTGLNHGAPAFSL